LDIEDVDMSKATFVAELGTLVHVFSHLRLTMHVQHFRIERGEVKEEAEEGLGGEKGGKGKLARKWVDEEDVLGETLSTGMRRCWELWRKGS
jgi:A/G-specific adenine glycosylase